MWQFFWDIIGYIHDNVPRWAKITIALLALAAIGFFFGYRTSLVVLGAVLWIVVTFFVVAHVVVLSRNLRKHREKAPPPLTPADQADIAEFQAAMQGPIQPPSTGQAPTDIPPRAG